MRVLAPAKINLHLRVGRRRADGFHPIVSWMCTIGLFDTLIFERARQKRFALSCDQAELPVDQGNLVVRAAGALAGDSPGGVLGSPVSVGSSKAELHKQIPVGAGLGGGSSDGARTLIALNHLLKTGLSREELRHRAAALGSDMPFFLNGPSAVCTGRGEKVCSIAAPRAGWALLMLAPFGLSTAEVYRKFDELGLGWADAEPQEPWDKWVQLSAESLLSRLANDLEAPAFSLRPELKNLHDQAEQSLQRAVRMSGSGSTLFTLYDAETEAEQGRGAMSKGHGFTMGMSIKIVQLCPEIRDDLSEETRK